MREGRPTLPDNVLPELKQAESIIQASITELIQIAGQITLWEAIGSDKVLHDRLGPSSVGTVTATVYYALQNSIVLGLARMFDDTALNANQAFNTILKTDNADWLLEHHKAQIRARGVMMIPRPGISPAEQAETERQILEASAQEVGQEFKERIEAFKQARKEFKKNGPAAALDRLKRMRNKEIAHNVLDTIWTTDRPKLGDLYLVFNAACGLVWGANYLCLASDHNDLREIERFKVRARCFTAVLRPEKREEHEAARAAVESIQTST